MKIHEYQAKELMQRYGIPLPSEQVADSHRSAVQISESMLTIHGKIVLKAQVHAGGRGKAGGVRFASNLDEAETAIAALLGKRLVNEQTGPEGKPVNRILIGDGSGHYTQELYLSVLLDRQKERPVIIASAAGGVEIEQVAATQPERIVKEYVHPVAGLYPFQARRIASLLGLKGSLFQEASEVILNLYRMFLELDATQVEINPLAVNNHGKLIALDAKVNLDDWAFYRHSDLAGLRDISQESPLEVQASKFGLNYIKLDGQIGCMVNGAGLAMATMDIIKLFGGAPANFLDVGGGANEDNIAEAFKILLSDADVKAVLVNIFGGIVRCDRVARGILSALQTIALDRPLVVRLAGTNSEEGNRLLENSGMKLFTVVDMEEAARKVISQLEEPRQ